MPDASDIREALASYLEEELNATPYFGVHVETRFRTFRDTSRGRRQEVMGDDLYYLEVLPAPDGTTYTDRDIGHTYHLLQHTVSATLFYKHTDADSFQASSQPAWNCISDAMMRAIASAEAGVETEGLIARAQLQQSASPQFEFDLVSLGAGRNDTDMAHALTATVTLRENSRS